MRGKRRVASRIRAKLILLHTTFSVVMASIILLALRPALKQTLADDLEREAQLAVVLALVSPDTEMPLDVQNDLDITSGDAASLDLPDDVVDDATKSPGAMVSRIGAGGWPVVVVFDSPRERFIRATVRRERPTRALARLYLLVSLSMLGIYALVALTLELLILPRQVYEPIAELLRADAAVQAGDRDRELIPEGRIRGDELGQIMRSRNASIVKLREQERRLNEALARIEEIANEIRRKNHLLESARRNLADQDRLVSLGMLSAGLAHEMNTPLAVLKGSVQELERGPLQPSRVALMGRVVDRLERLSESLLDFARVRPPSSGRIAVHRVIDEAWSLVSIDRDAKAVTFDNDSAPGADVSGDADRLTQVFVNLLRNAVDAMDGRGALRVTSAAIERDGEHWVSVTLTDTGPGISPEMIPKLFEPFASTRLDAKGTGLGLAVAEGIVREHGGAILARNRAEGGACFEVMLPAWSTGGQTNSEYAPEDEGAVAPGERAAANHSDGAGAS